MGKKKQKLEKGKFYHIYGGKPHPAQIYEKDKKHGTYKAIKTGTTKRKGMIEIKPIQPGKQSFVHNRPYEGTRRDFSNRELLGMKFDSSDFDKIEAIKKRRAILTRSAKKKYKK